VPSKGRALLSLVRLPNGLLAALAVIVGARWAGAWWGYRPIMAALAAIALTGFANSLNDYQDREIDRVAHPDRPLPSGALKPIVAIMIALSCAEVAMAASIAAVPSGGVVALTAVVLAVMAVYGPLKRHAALLANLVVAILGSLPFVYGAWAAGAPRAAWPLVALAAPLHLAREFAKDATDVSGDLGHRRTVPLTVGLTVTRWLSVVAAAAAVGVLAAIVAHWPDRRAAWWAGALLAPAVVACVAGIRETAGGRSAWAYKLAMGLATVGLLAAPRG
jgi:geranylgeranylglycerol-phosphate geranylgeranyltransferase